MRILLTCRIFDCSGFSGLLVSSFDKYSSKPYEILNGGVDIVVHGFQMVGFHCGHLYLIIIVMAK